MLPEIFMLMVATGGGADGTPVALGHAAEVKLFASTMATVKVVTGACTDMLPNAAYLAGLRDRLQITEADEPAFAEEGSAVSGMLGQGLAEARPETPGAQPPIGSTARPAR